jgi:hypothetical protein
MRSKLCRQKRIVKKWSNCKDDDDDDDDNNTESSGSSEEEHACSSDHDAYSSYDSYDETVAVTKRPKLGSYKKKVGDEAQFEACNKY